ncbi:docking protein 2 isoform X1 [Poecilia formosa]|uniref:Docking protein 2-like n=2 Tax=Poecilia formosa TaxID=48698 RepID=A0A087XUD2_POEFO|nr:PREDICTED: docking protein 2-like isoform X1 [Poecilia formosa]
MDSHIKTGKVYLKPHKPHKKWKPVRLSLFAPSSSSVGRLEIRDGGGGADLRRPHQLHGEKKVKVVRLSELISVLRLPPNAEACHLDNMSTFCVETEDRTLVFAAPKDDCLEWVDKLCHSSFQREKSSGSSQVHMEENQIYASADEAPQFWVAIQKNDAATRCGLQGSYWLQLEQQSLLLRDAKKKTKVMEWPYELLRRYGHDKVSLTVEAGRRCESGPGTFCFETQQADKLFNLIQSNIKRNALAAASGSQSQDTEKVLVTNIQPHSPLPKIPDPTNMADILENKLRMQDRRSPVFDNMAKGLDDSVGLSEGSPAPITLMPLPSIPTLDGTSGDKLKSQSNAIYADPNDCGLSIVVPKPATAQYIDPARVLPLKPPISLDSDAALPNTSDSHPDAKADVPDSVYSEVYDKISPDKNKQPVLQNATKTSDEPIYSEPVSRKESDCQKPEPKPDPFEHLYAQVCKAPTSSRNAAPVTTTTTSSRTTMTSSTVTGSSMSREEPLDDVIYENLGII